MRHQVLQITSASGHPVTAPAHNPSHGAPRAVEAQPPLSGDLPDASRLPGLPFFALVTALCSVVSCGGDTVGNDTTGPAPPLAGEIAFASNRDSGIYNIYAIRPPDTAMRRVTPSSVSRAELPQWSPDGARLAFWGVVGLNSGIYVVNADGSGLVAQASDNVVPNELYSSPTWSPDGSTLAFLAYRNGTNGTVRVLAKRLDSQNIDTLFTIGTGSRMLGLAWSPDGSRIAYSRKSGEYERWSIAVTQINTGNTLALTPPIDAGGAAWSPDGSTIAFSANTCGGSCSQIYLINPDGTNLRVVTSLPGTTVGDFMGAWSPDGARIVFSSTVAGNIPELYVVDVDGRNRIRLTNNGADERLPTWRR